MHGRGHTGDARRLGQLPEGGVVVGPERLAEPQVGRAVEGPGVAAPVGPGAIDPVSRRWRRILRIHATLTEKREAIWARVPSRASQAATTRSRRSVE
jgi:hypothetical protein